MGPKSIYYFDSTSTLVQWIYKYCQFQKIGSLAVTKVNHHIGEIRLENGENCLKRIHTDAREIIGEIKNSYLNKNIFLKDLNVLWSTKTLVHYFEQKIEIIINRECRRIYLSKWMCNNHLKQINPGVYLYILNTKWFNYLKGYAKEQNIFLKSH